MAYFQSWTDDEVPKIGIMNMGNSQFIYRHTNWSMFKLGLCSEMMKRPISYHNSSVIEHSTVTMFINFDNVSPGFCLFVCETLVYWM